MVLRLLGLRRKKSRTERIADQVKSAKSWVDKEATRRVRQDDSSDSFWLSFVSGALLGICVGVVVAITLSKQLDGRTTTQTRPTGIELLPRGGSREQSRSSAMSG